MMFRPENTEADYDFSGKNKYSWRKFLVRNKDIKLTQAEYSEIIETCNGFLMDIAVEKGVEVKLPYGNGKIKIFKYKPVVMRKTKSGEKRINLTVDWGATNRLWKSDPQAKENKKLIYHLNTHTDGYQIKIKWMHGTQFPLIGCWKFKRAQTLGRRVSSFLKSGKGLVHTYESFKPFK